MAAAVTTTTPDNPAKKDSGAGAGGSQNSGGGGLAQYLREVRAELKKAEWPTRDQLIKMTQVVLVLIFVVAAYCGGLDFLFGLVTNKLFNRPAG